MISYRLIYSLWLALAVLTAGAQRIGCVIPGDRAETRAGRYFLPDPYDFDPQTVYRQPVVLVSFNDMDFSMADPQAYYGRVCNEKGYNEGVGLGCLADYFREQSGGCLNLQFDVYGPVKVNKQSGGHGQEYHGLDIPPMANEELRKLVQNDFSIYDWDGDGMVNQVIFVLAGYSGNLKTGYAWPNTTSYSFKLPGDVPINYGSIITELWNDGSVMGFGTIAHEFCHCLGLPDLYPLGNATAFSAVDEWDLMDGGNYTNKGWCPPNLSAMEKMYLGWGDPEELTTETTITGMKSLSDGGKTYIIRNSGHPDEYYLLENRQQTGWDYGIPGQGLLIYHVDYTRDSWGNNQVNISDTHYRYDLFHADGKNYLDWDPNNDGKDSQKWSMPNCLRNIYLSTSTYPYADNQSLTDSSSPAATLFTENVQGKLFMSKSVTNILQAADGTISFDFMKEGTGIRGVKTNEGHTPWYDLHGRQLPGEPQTPGLYINSGKLILRQTHR